MNAKGVGTSGAVPRVLRVALAIAALGGVGLFHVWTHTRVVTAGYALGDLNAVNARLAAERDRLRMEVATLRAPGRLERFARVRLGMAPPAPGSVVAGRAGWAAAGGLGRAGRAGPEDRRPGPVEPSSKGALALREMRRVTESP
jgi:cell division protein FtsL